MRFAMVGLILAFTVFACAKQTSNGTARLSWNPVKTDLSGTTLTNIAGYKIYYGTSPRAMGTVVVLKNPSQTSYVVENLHAGTWYFIINIANEWGPIHSATWATAYQTAIARLRAAGYSTPIMIDTGGWGQDVADLLTYAKEVFNSDPQKNIIFSFHVYRGLSQVWTPATLNAFALQLRALSASTGMAFVFAEFGPGRDLGPSPTLLTPQQVIGAAEAAGIGWMGWSWDCNNLPNGASNNNSFSMTLNGPGMYTVPSDLTTYGKEVVLSSYGLVNARKATDF